MLDTPLDDEQINVAVRSELASGRRPQEDDPVGGSHRDDAPEDFVQQGLGASVEHGDQSGS